MPRFAPEVAPHTGPLNQAIIGGTTIMEHAIAEAEQRWGSKWYAVKIMRVKSRFRQVSGGLYADVDLGWHVRRKEATDD